MPFSFAKPLSWDPQAIVARTLSLAGCIFTSVYAALFTGSAPLPPPPKAVRALNFLLPFHVLPRCSNFLWYLCPACRHGLPAHPLAKCVQTYAGHNLVNKLLSRSRGSMGDQSQITRTWRGSTSTIPLILAICNAILFSFSKPLDHPALSRDMALQRPHAKESVNADRCDPSSCPMATGGTNMLSAFTLKFAYIVDQRWCDAGRVFKVKLWRDASRITMPRLTTGGPPVQRGLTGVVCRYATHQLTYP